jgi:hypothetical protein
MEEVREKKQKAPEDFTFLVTVFIMWCIVLLCTVMVLSSLYDHSAQNRAVVAELNLVLSTIQKNYGWILNPQNATGSK